MGEASGSHAGKTNKRAPKEWGASEGDHAVGYEEMPEQPGPSAAPAAAAGKETDCLKTTAPRRQEGQALS